MDKITLHRTFEETPEIFMVEVRSHINYLISNISSMQFDKIYTLAKEVRAAIDIAASQSQDIIMVGNPITKNLKSCTKFLITLKWLFTIQIYGVLLIDLGYHIFKPQFIPNTLEIKKYGNETWTESSSCGTFNKSQQSNNTTTYYSTGYDCTRTTPFIFKAPNLSNIYIKDSCDPEECKAHLVNITHTNITRKPDVCSHIFTPLLIGATMIVDIFIRRAISYMDRLINRIKIIEKISQERAHSTIIRNLSEYICHRDNVQRSTLIRYEQTLHNIFSLENVGIEDFVATSLARLTSLLKGNSQYKLISIEGEFIILERIYHEAINLKSIKIDSKRVSMNTTPILALSIIPRMAMSSSLVGIKTSHAFLIATLSLSAIYAILSLVEGIIFCRKIPYMKNISLETIEHLNHFYNRIDEFPKEMQTMLINKLILEYIEDPLTIDKISTPRIVLRTLRQLYPKNSKERERLEEKLMTDV